MESGEGHATIRLRVLPLLVFFSGRAAAFDEECSIWQLGTCLLNPPQIRNQCEAKKKSYNPTVGVDKVSGGVTITETFPVAPGLATKNSAINVLKGTGYDPTSFGQAILKYTYNANILWSVGQRDFALPDTVSVYTAKTSCSLETDTTTSAIRSTADASASESKKRGTGFSQSVNVGKGPVKSQQKVQVGFGRSSGTGSYSKAASVGLDEAYTIRAKAVAFTATIATTPLTSCDMNEYFVAAVLKLAQALKTAPEDPSEHEQEIDRFIELYGTHLPTKFELGCEVERTYRFSSMIDESAKQDSLTKASNSGFSAFGFSTKSESTSSESSSNSQVESKSEAIGSTQITCGSQQGTLDDFCDSVVMNDDQSRIPKMLSVDSLVPVWSIVEQVDPWTGTGTQESPEISRAAITEAADAIARRFEALTSATGDSMCTTAGSLDPPMENGICAYDGGWDCSQCSCYDTNFEPDNPFAVTPVSSCNRTVCQPELLTKGRPAAAAPYLVWGYGTPMTKAQCNQMCLQLPVQFGYQCRGFYFEPYKLEVFSHDESGDSPDLVYASGACELYKATLSEKDLVRQQGPEFDDPIVKKFKAIDTSGDDFIDQDELEAFIKDDMGNMNYFGVFKSGEGWHEAVAGDIIEDFDQNGDGLISFDEFKAGMEDPNAITDESDQDVEGGYFQYTPRKNGCDVEFDHSKVLKGEVCVGAQSATAEEQLTSQQACFAKCEAQLASPDTSTHECVAASYDKESKKCTLQTRDECSDLVSDKSTVVAKVWCGRAARWIPSAHTGHESKQQCAADGTWYFCGDSECDGNRKCADPGSDLQYCACPILDTGVIYEPNLDDQVYTPEVQCEADGSWYACGNSKCNLQRKCHSNPNLWNCACPTHEWGDRLHDACSSAY